jgi:hypothetical protein
VERLREWKVGAEKAAFDALTTGNVAIPPILINLGLDASVLEGLGLKDANIDDLAARLHAAAQLDISAFKSTARWAVLPGTESTESLVLS